MIEVLRHQDTIRDAVLEAEWNIARSEWVAALALSVAGGEQPDNQALPVDGAMRGAEPISLTDQREVQ